MVNLFTIPLEWPEDASQRAEMERGVLEFLEQRLGASPKFEAILDRMVPGSTEALAASVAEHWPAESARPDVVSRFLGRFGG